MFDETWYKIGAYSTGVVTFFAIWIYAFVTWGFLVGLAIGWLPAIIGAFIAALLWPLIAFIVVAFIVLIVLLEIGDTYF